MRTNVTTTKKILELVFRNTFRIAVIDPNSEPAPLQTKVLLIGPETLEIRGWLDKKAAMNSGQIKSLFKLKNIADYSAA